MYYGEELGLEGKLDHGARLGMPWHNKKLWDMDLQGLYKKLAALRGNNAVLKTGKFSFLEEYCDGEILAFKRFLPGGGQLICLMNNSGAKKKLSLAAGLFGKKPRISINGGVEIISAGGGLTAKLPPRSFAVLA